MGIVEQQHVATWFFEIGLPLVPVTSVLVTPQGEIELNPQFDSIAAGYVRAIAGFMILFGCILLFIPTRVFGFPESMPWRLAVSGLLIVVWSYRFWRLTAAERQRRSILHAVTGLAIDPEHLLPETRREILAALDARRQLVPRAGADQQPAAQSATGDALTYAWNSYAAIEHPQADSLRRMTRGGPGPVEHSKHRPGVMRQHAILPLLAVLLIIPWDSISLRMPHWSSAGPASTPTVLSDIGACQRTVDQAVVCLHDGDIFGASCAWQKIPPYFQYKMTFMEEDGQSLGEWLNRFRRQMADALVAAMPRYAGSGTPAMKAAFQDLLDRFHDPEYSHRWSDACGTATAAWTDAVIVRLKVPSDAFDQNRWLGLQQTLLRTVQQQLPGRTVQLASPLQAIGATSYDSEIVLDVRDTDHGDVHGPNLQPGSLVGIMRVRSHRCISTWDGIHHILHAQPSAQPTTPVRWSLGEPDEEFTTLVAQDLRAALAALPDYALIPAANIPARGWDLAGSTGGDLLPWPGIDMGGLPLRRERTPKPVTIAATLDALTSPLVKSEIITRVIDGVTECAAGPMDVAAPAGQAEASSLLVQVVPQYLSYDDDYVNPDASKTASLLNRIPTALVADITLADPTDDEAERVHRRITVRTDPPQDVAAGWDMIVVQTTAWNDLLFLLQARIASAAWDPPAPAGGQLANPPDAQP